jgi:hypothetical protein
VPNRILIYIYIYMSNLMSLKLCYFIYNISRCFGRSLPIIRRSYTAWSAVGYGKRKCGRELWCTVVSLVRSVLPWHCLSGKCYIKLDTHYFMIHGTMILRILTLLLLHSLKLHQLKYL